MKPYQEPKTHQVSVSHMKAKEKVDRLSDKQEE